VRQLSNRIAVEKALIALAIVAMFAGAQAAAAPVLDEITVEFELQNRDGEPVRLSSLRGQNVLLAFGFTNCVHICPMIAANMARVIRATDKNVTGVFVSVDTERDSPAVVDAYARRFDKKMVGLSGTHEQVSQAARNFKVTFVVTKSEDNYTVQHTPSIFLIGPDGELLEVFAMNAPSDEIAAAMR